ncbi:MAG TPA: hypothetical protein VJW95_05040 [Dissulfurispiraceae bacterium]|nr:hypothetical protein [Dissulfurispiraceae bacterium]
MKILYILKKDLDETGKKIFETHETSNQVTSVRLEEKSADELLDLIEGHDKLIMW